MVTLTPMKGGVINVSTDTNEGKGYYWWHYYCNQCVGLLSLTLALSPGKGDVIIATTVTNEGGVYYCWHYLWHHMLLFLPLSLTPIKGGVLFFTTVTFSDTSEGVTDTDERRGYYWWHCHWYQWNDATDTNKCRGYYPCHCHWHQWTNVLIWRFHPHYCSGDNLKIWILPYVLYQLFWSLGQMEGTFSHQGYKEKYKRDKCSTLSLLHQKQIKNKWL